MTASRRSALWLSVLLLFGAVSLTAADKTGYSRKQLQNLYLAGLKQAGYAPSLDADGDVEFQKGKGNYFIQVTEDDPRYFRLVFPNFWKHEAPGEREQALAAADAVNSDNKVVKVYSQQGDTWASVELLLKDPADFKPLLPRALEMIQGAVDDFIQHMGTHGDASGDAGDDAADNVDGDDLDALED